MRFHGRSWADASSRGNKSNPYFHRVSLQLRTQPPVAENQRQIERADFAVAVNVGRAR